MNGRLTSGICSTRRRLYANRPSTAMPTITIVANTGFRIDTRVIHMVWSPPKLVSAGHLCRAGRRRGRGNRPCRRRLDDRGRAVRQIVETRAQNRRSRRQRGLDLDAIGGSVASAGHDVAFGELAVLDGPDKRLTAL